MAVKEKATGFRELITEIKQNIFHPFYLLAGDEDYYIDELIKLFEERVVPEEEKDFNLTVCYGMDTDISTVIAAAQQFPVMSDKRLVILKEVQTMQNYKKQLDKLAIYLDNPNPTTVFVVTLKVESFPTTSEIIKKIKSNNHIFFKSDKLKNYQLEGAIRDYCMAKGVSIDDKGISMLCDYIGNPLSKLFGEIDKLIISSGTETKKITPDLIERNIGISKDFNIYELTEALSRKDYSKCTLITKHFASNPKQNPGVMITASLFNFFSKLMVANLLKDKSDVALKNALEIKNNFALKEYKQALSLYNSKSTMAAIHFIRELDTKSKGVESFQNEYDLLQETIFKIISFK